jgi:hypothetical protein
MTDKAQFPIGKTQWSKWNDEQKTAFNEAREAGVPFADAIQAANETKTKKRSLFDKIEAVAEDVVSVAGAVGAVSPAVATAVGVAKAIRGSKKK